MLHELRLKRCHESRAKVFELRLKGCEFRAKNVAGRVRKVLCSGAKTGAGPAKGWRGLGLDVKGESSKSFRECSEILARSERSCGRAPGRVCLSGGARWLEGYCWRLL